jgi:class 3 adenylate cyclase
MSQQQTLTLPAVKRPREFHYRWEWQFDSSPEMLWPLVSNTDRFNRDTGVPAIEFRRDRPIVNNRRRLKLYRFNLFGLKLIPIEWDEDPFEWMQPHRFGVTRTYVTGPVAYMRTQTELQPRPDGGTQATYTVDIAPNNPLGYAAIIAQVGILSAWRFHRVFQRYDRLAREAAKAEAAKAEAALGRPQLSPGARTRLHRIREVLIHRGAAPALLDTLIELIERGDSMTLIRLRPYVLADAWGAPRRDVLELCLLATRAGMLDLRWELLCPLCRGAKEIDARLEDVNTQVHCEVCNIDFEINFDRSVEVTFRPNSTVRMIGDDTYCVGGPQVTPHIAAQQLVRPDQNVTVMPKLEAGRYRLRTMLLGGGQYLRVEEGGRADVILAASADGWPSGERIISTRPALVFENRTDEEQLFILERLAWSDQAATAAEVTALQLFRDLFSSEALRPGAQLSVGAITVAFTDLRGSTRLYREIGDAPAFGVVLDHFEVLKKVVGEEGGAIVKTIGDSVMAVFRQPVSALRAMLRAQELLANPPGGMRPLLLKVGINTGPSIAVTLNERLDYFGTTVNLAARLAGLSDGSDVIITPPVQQDPDVQDLLNFRDVSLSCEAFVATLRGFDDEPFELCRIEQGKYEITRGHR